MADPVRVLARVLLASVLVVVGGQRLLSGLDALAGTAPPRAMIGLAVAAVHVLLGLTIVAGWRLKWTASAAAAALLAEGYLAHPFWLLSGPAFATHLADFMKNVAIAGGLLLLAATAPRAERRWFR